MIRQWQPQARFKASVSRAVIALIEAGWGDLYRPFVAEVLDAALHVGKLVFVLNGETGG